MLGSFTACISLVKNIITGNLIIAQWNGSILVSVMARS